MDRALRPLYLFGAITNKDLHYFQQQRHEANGSEKEMKTTEFSIYSPAKRNTKGEKIPLALMWRTMSLQKGLLVQHGLLVTGSN